MSQNIIFVGERFRRNPRHVNARQLHVLGDVDTLLSGNLRRRHIARWPNCAVGKCSEIMVNELLRRIDVDVASDHQDGVPRRVVLVVEVAHVLQGCAVQILHRADDHAVVRMRWRIDRLGELLARGAVRTILDLLAALLLDDLALVIELCLGDIEKTHAIALEPQCELELMRRHDLEVVGAVVGRGAI